MEPGSLRDVIETTTRDFLKSAEFAAIVKDPSVVCRDLDPECRRRIVPRTFMAAIQTDEDRLFSNTEAEAAANENILVSAVKKTEILNLTIDEAARKSAARTVSIMKFRDGEEMTLESSWFFDLTEDGRKIKAIVEFCGEETARKRVEKTVALLMKRTAMGGCDVLCELVFQGGVEMKGSIYDGIRYPSMN